MNERETESCFHSQFQIAGFRGAGAASKRRTEKAARLTGCKAISLFGNSVVSVCGLELTRECLSHAKCRTITAFCSWSRLNPSEDDGEKRMEMHGAGKWHQKSILLINHKNWNTELHHFKTTEGSSNELNINWDHSNDIKLKLGSTFGYAYLRLWKITLHYTSKCTWLIVDYFKEIIF